MYWLFVVLLSIALGDVIDRLKCPICEMAVEKVGFNQSLNGHQGLHACFMAGHLEKLVEHTVHYFTLFRIKT